MKTKLKYLTILIFYISIILQLHSQGYIVPNGVTYAGFDGYGYGINVVHNPATAPAGGSTTGFDLDPIGKTPPTLYTNTFRFDPIADVGVRAFIVSSNQPVSLQPILSQTYPELIASPNSGYVFTNGVPVYLALYTGNVQYAPPNGIYSDPLFGWVELVNNQGVIQMLGGALEYQGGGIYAGTDTIIPVPEPGTCALFLCGAAVFGVRRWKRQT